MRQPNFFIVGASKAGTTSLWQYLLQHPDIFMPDKTREKEPSFFCDLKPPWALKYSREETYRALFAAAGGEKAVGEASTAYLVSPESPRRIRNACPDAKIIIILRDPARRAFSLYNFLCELGFEWITPFERALEKEDQRAADQAFKFHNPFWYYAYLYYRSGLYAGQIAHYLNEFPREQIHFVLFDDLKQDPEKTTVRICQFLDVDPDFHARTETHNRTTYPLSVTMQHLIVRGWNGHPLLESQGGLRVVDRVLHLAFHANLVLGRMRGPRRMRPETHRRLALRYREDIERTATLIGRNLDSWLAVE